MDLANKKNLSKRLDMILFHHNSIRKSLGRNKIDKRKLIDDLTKISSKILKYSNNLKNIVFRFEMMLSGSKITFSEVPIVLKSCVSKNAARCLYFHPISTKLSDVFFAYVEPV